MRGECLRVSASSRTPGAKRREQVNQDERLRMTQDEMNLLTRNTRALANSILGQAISQKSIDEYARIIHRHSTSSETGELRLPDPQNMRKRTWFTVKAAFRRYYATQILMILKEADYYQRDGNQKDREFCLLRLADPITKISPEMNGLFAQIRHFDPTKERNENKGKRKTLKSFPDDWRQRIFDAATPRLRKSVAIHALTGCRPAELEKGITISESGEGVLTFRIQGAKTDRGHGQPVRTLTISRNPNNAIFYDVLEGGGEFKEDSGFVRVNLHRLSRKLWPRHKSTISAYSFRHQLASDIKKSGTDPIEIAMVLGHSGTRTQSLYGHAAQGGKGGASHGITVVGSRKVKDNRRLPPGRRPAEKTASPDSI